MMHAMVIIEVTQNAWQWGAVTLFMVGISVVAGALSVVASGSSDAEVANSTRGFLVAADDAKWAGIGLAVLLLLGAVMTATYAASGVHLR